MNSERGSFVVAESELDVEIRAQGHVTGAWKAGLVWALPLFYPLYYPAMFRGAESARAGSSLGIPLFLVGLVCSLAGPLAAWMTLNYLDKNNFERRQHRVAVLGALLTATNPPLYNVLGNFATQFHFEPFRLPAWYLINALVLAAAFVPAEPATTVMKYRRVHGYSAMLIFIFAVAHVSNHLMAIISLDAHQAVLRGLRLVYRERLIEIGLVTAVIVQVLTGTTMVWKSHLRRASSLKNLQTVSGLYIAIFLISHLRATFMERVVRHGDSNFAWATKAPAGVLSQANAVGLLPYYLLAVVMLFVHLGCQARWNLARVMSPSAARNVSYGLMAFGFLAAVTIALAACGVHFIS